MAWGCPSASVRRHHHTRRAKPALQAVVILKRLLDRVQRAVRCRLTFDGGHLGAVRPRRQHRAGFHRNAVHMHNAGAALAGVTSHMRPGQMQLSRRKDDNNVRPSTSPDAALPFTVIETCAMVFLPIDYFA